MVPATGVAGAVQASRRHRARDCRRRRGSLRPCRYRSSLMLCAVSLSRAVHLSRKDVPMIPHPSTSAIIAVESAHTSGAYPKRPIAVVRGEGACLWDADGRMYVDCVGGQGAANLGHANPAVVAAISAQAAQLISCPEIFRNDQRAAYLDELVAALPCGMARVFLCNSGSEAIEGALKVARLLTGRAGVVAAVRGFHGRTLGALSATWEPKYRAPFAWPHRATVGLRSLRH